MFPLRRERPARAAQAAEEKARDYIAKVNLAEFADSLSAHAVRRHEAARRDRARHGDGARHPADGRAVRRARCADAAQDAGRAAGAVGRHALHRAVRHAFDSPRRSRSAAASCCCRRIPGQVKAELNSLPRRRAGAHDVSGARAADPRDAVRRRRRGTDAGARMTASAACAPRTTGDHRASRSTSSAFGVVEKPLSTWERIANIGAVRKVALLVAAGAHLGSLRALAQQSAAVSDVRRDASRRSSTACRERRAARRRR